MRTQVLVLIALLTLPASQARAQGPPAGSLDPRWSAWVGCWTPSTRAGANQDAQVCIVPAPDAGGIQLISFDGDRELLNERFVADGSSQPLSERACSGERTSRWAAAGPRLFTSSTARCASQPPIETSRLFALVTRDQWLDIQVSKSGGREQVRTQRFWRSTGEPPAAVANALVQVTPPRTVITAVTVDDVIEASRHLPPNAIEAWLAESSTRVRVDRSALVKLADAKVSTDVIDLMVALAYPQKFEVRRGGGSGGGGFWSGPFDDGFYPGDWGYLADVFTYGFGFGYPYWIGANGYYYYPGGVYVQPGGGGGGAAEEAHGQVVNGLGYTRVQPRAPAHGTAAPGSSASSSGAGGGSDGGSSGSGSSSGSSSGVSSSGYSGGGGGTSTGLTAVPR